MYDLNDDLKPQVIRLCEQALSEQEKERFKASNNCLTQVLELLPEPKIEWKAYTWLISNIADNLVELQKHTEALEMLESLFEMTPDSKTNAYLCMRLGQCHFELENKEDALTWLKTAFELEGKDIFEAESSKYYTFVKNSNKSADS